MQQKFGLGDAQKIGRKRLVSKLDSSLEILNVPDIYFCQVVDTLVVSGQNPIFPLACLQVSLLTAGMVFLNTHDNQIKTSVFNKELTNAYYC